MPPSANASAASVGSNLAFPLPAGMRDWLPHESEAQNTLAQHVLASFELFGYQRVTVPVFEYAAVLENGAAGADSDALLRFVEPETGAVLALRSDLTPQVARLVATRLAEMPRPARLCYHGSVLRRRHERARQHRQVPQAGIELVGCDGPDGDLEVLHAAVAAVRAAGLTDFMLDLGHARVVGALLAEVPADQRPGLVEALLLKDAFVVERRARACNVSGALLNALVELPSLNGDASIWPRAQKVLAGTPAEPFVGELHRLAQGLARAKLGTRVFIDFGETRNFEYYTGPMFQILAHGPGEAVGSGGRYDGLLARFGLDCPAAGFALNLDHLAWAIERGGAARPAPRRLVLEDADEGQLQLAAELRAQGVSVARHSSALLTYAQAWDYTHVIRPEPGGARIEVVGTSQVTTVSGAGAELAAAIAQATLTRRV